MKRFVDPVQAPVYRSAARPSVTEERGETVIEVVVSWGAEPMLAVAHLRSGERFVLTSRGSSSPDAHTFVHPAMEHGVHVLVDFVGREGRVTPLGGAAFVLARGEGARIEHDEVRYELRHVPRAERLPARRGDRLFGVATMVTLVGTIAAGSWIGHGEHDDRLTREDEDERRGYLIEHALRARSYAPTHAEGTGASEGGTGLRAVGDEGAAGSRRAPRVSRAWSTPPQRGPTRDGSRSGEAVLSARDRVLRRGVFSALGEVGSVPWGVVLPGDGATRQATGAMYGETTGDARGYEGLGLLGTGWGGGSTGGLIGLGRMPTRGHGTDDGTGQGIGGGSYCGCGEGMLPSRATGRAGIGVRALANVGTTTGCVLGRDAASATYDAGEVRRVVVRNLGQVRHCYEQALTEVPNAEGRVAMRWVIGGDGAVIASTVTDNGTGSAGLGECVASAVRRWQFPAPEGGGVVTVNYPFDLSVVDP